MNFFLREAWNEFRAGLRGGVLPLVYLVLSGYILIVMTSAENLQKMGAMDIPRNAPGLVYLMTSGDAFFLFFAWAWIFAQPIVRDRNVQLHEVVLAAPISLRSLLAARYTGALGVALLLGTSQILGFLAAPLLEAIGAVPPGSVANAPWMAFGWAALVFTLPLAAGAGALYFMAALRTRGVGGPFAVAALLMAFWMVSMIVFKEGHADPFLVTILDPSGFAEAEHQVVDQWTPHQKSTALLALTPALLWNRLIWGAVPLALLAISIIRTTRESLILGRGVQHPSPRRNNRTRLPIAIPDAQPCPTVTTSWCRAVFAESRWQIRQIIASRGLWIAMGFLVLLAVAAGFAHGVHHAYGPMVARTEYVSPVLLRTFYLIVVFMVAAMVGMAARRDEQPGLSEMFDAAPAPNSVRLTGRAVASLAIAVICSLIPAAGAIITGLLTTQGISLMLPVLHQMTVLLPAILEMAAITLLLHAVIRHPGTAHAAAILAAFIMVVNFEVGLVNYPPWQIGRGVDIALSGLTGFSPWIEKILASNSFKLALIITIIALAAAVNRRGTDEGWRSRMRQFRAGLLGRSGLAVVAGMVALAGCSIWLHQRFVTEGGYETEEQRLAKDATWESRWLSRQGNFSVQGGEVVLTIVPEAGELHGQWRLEGVSAAGEEIHALLPTGFELLGAQVDGLNVTATVDDDHLALPLPNDRNTGCTIDLSWRLPASGWNTGGHSDLAQPSWLVGDSFWLRAADVMPRLGFDAKRVIRTAADRSRLGLPKKFTLPFYRASLAHAAAAPTGQWIWRVEIKGREADIRHGQLDGLLDFAAQTFPNARRTQVDGVTLVHDNARGQDALAIAEDLAAMSLCVARRLGRAPIIDTVAQWPRGLPTGSGDAAVAGTMLLLAEEPHWDVADTGTGRLARRADIAAALARRAIGDASDLREGEGGLWIGDGLAGAIGLLCVAETDGTEALLALLSRGSQSTTKALAGAENPVGPLALAVHDKWGADYASLAAMQWASRLSPQDIEALAESVRRSGDIAGSLAGMFGEDDAKRYLGPPSAVDLHVQEVGTGGERWTWQGGGWELQDAKPVPRGISTKKGRLIWTDVPTSTAASTLLLDDWPAYEREPRDNMASGRTQ